MPSLIGSVGILNNPNGTTHSTAFGQAPTPGNMLVMFVHKWRTSNADTTSAAPAGWTKAGADSFFVSLTGMACVEAFYKVAVAGEAAPVLTSANATTSRIYIEEWTELGALNAVAVDVLGSNQATDSATVSVATTLNGCFVLAFGTGRRTNANSVMTLTNSDSMLFDNDANTYTRLGTHTQTTAGTFSDTATCGYSGSGSTGFTQFVGLALLAFNVSLAAEVDGSTANFDVNLQMPVGGVANTVIVPQTLTPAVPFRLTLFQPTGEIAGTQNEVAMRLDDGSMGWGKLTTADVGVPQQQQQQRNPFDGWTISGIPIPGTVLTAISSGSAEWRVPAGTTEPPSGSLPDYAPAGVSGPFNPSNGIFNWKPSNTQRHRASLITAQTAAVHHVFVGDSVTAGWNYLSPDGVSSASADRLHAYPMIYRDNLSQRLGLTPGGTGYVRSSDARGLSQPYYDDRWTGPMTNWQHKGHYIQGNSFTPAVTFVSDKAGTIAAVTVIDRGNLTISVDGATSGAGFLSVTGGNTNAVKRYVFSGLANTTHTIKVTPVGQTWLAGAMVYNNLGIQAHNIAQGGSKAADINHDQTEWDYISTIDLSMVPHFTDAVGCWGQTPSTVYLLLGGNDIHRMGTTQGPMDFIAAACADVASKFVGSDIVLIAVCHGSQQFSTLDIKPYLAAMYQQAYDHDWPLWDLEYFTGGYEQLQAQGYTGDTWGHLNPAGYAYLGQTLAGIAAS